MSRKEYEYQKRLEERKRRAKVMRKNRRDRVSQKHTSIAPRPRTEEGEEK